MVFADTDSSGFPGRLQKSPHGYEYYMPGDIFASGGLLSHPPLSLMKQAETAGIALGKFSLQIEKAPNPPALVAAYSHLEANSSSRIEGTQTDIQDAFTPEEEMPKERRDDWHELQAYIAALHVALDELNKLPLSNRLLCAAHWRLLQQARGKDKMPGEFRRSQNWIGGGSPGNAHFVPPIHTEVGGLMSRLEKFMHEKNSDMPDLVRAALIHYQFETIHPFLDGNGRMGRMLVALYLLKQEVIAHPILYISAYIEKNRQNYYAALDRARQNPDGVVKWISFFLDAVEHTAKDGAAVTQKFIDLQTRLREKDILSLGKRAKKGLVMLDVLFQYPFINAKMLREKTGFGASTRQALIADFLRMEIIKEITGNRRNRVFVFVEYFKLLQKAGAAR